MQIARARAWEGGYAARAVVGGRAGAGNRLPGLWRLGLVRPQHRGRIGSMQPQPRGYRFRHAGATVSPSAGGIRGAPAQAGERR